MQLFVTPQHAAALGPPQPRMQLAACHMQPFSSSSHPRSSGRPHLPCLASWQVSATLGGVGSRPGSKSGVAATTSTRSRTATAAAAGAIAPDGDGAMIQTDLEEAQQAAMDATGLSRGQLWFAAIKPPMYSVCIIPVLVGAALAYYQTGVFAAGRYLMLTLASICVIAWLNLSNDAFDAGTGVDASKPESMVNLTGNRGAVLWAANGFLAAATALFTHSLIVPGDPRPVQLLGVALALGYMYQGPPFRLSYKGLGEPLCMVAFGPLSTGAFYLAQAGAAAGAAGTVPSAVWAASTVVGLSIAVILFCSHFHQIEGDRASGKMSPLVRLGPDNALQVLRVAVASSYLLLAAFAVAGWLPATCLAASAASLPGAGWLLRFGAQNRLVPEAIRPLKKYAIKWQAPLGLALAAGLIWARRAGHVPTPVF